MRVLIVGNGGREHALLWKLRRDAPSAEFFATRPNGGMAPLCKAVQIAPTDVEALAGWAAAHRIDLTVVGPEAPLAAGIVDRFEARGLPVFGPTKDAARIESSKAYAKDLMRGAGIPTAEYRTFTDGEAAEAYARDRGAPLVVKASGLAAGKGAIVCTSVEDAVAAIRSMLADLEFGEAGREVVIEECMEGEELSVFAVTDGERCAVLVPAQDHKRVGEGDTGPNTGGMGAYAPVTLATPELVAAATSEVIQPTLAALAADGCPFRGLLYAGLMLTQDGLRVVEFNCRFGDPEAQVVLPLMSSSLLDLLATVAEGGSLAGRTAGLRQGAAVTTVVASGGYPGAYGKGKAIVIPDGLETDDLLLFHAGTELADGRLVTSGGRVLAVTALASRFSEAVEASRAGAAKVAFDGAFYRQDIGWRERSRLEAG
ncbi:MAG TPA: phosphoribosylamine--glycine ligase [Longimicrobiales bacterium]|nr:phosphoribosylamine--glycine ligase [Longimicrobiales bacterium]